MSGRDLVDEMRSGVRPISDRSPRGIFDIVIAAIAITLYQDVQKKAKLAADAGTIAALRSAVAIYYGKHNGNFPSSGDLNSLVVPSPTFQCSGNTYSLFASNGKISFSTNEITDC